MLSGRRCREELNNTDLAPPDHLREGERPGLGGLGTRPDQGQRPGGRGELIHTIVEIG